MHFVVKKIAKIVVGAVGLAVLGLSTITAQPAKAADSGASTDNSVVTVADKNLSSDTIFPNFMYGRGITTTHQSDQNYNGRMYATGEHYVSGTPTFTIFESTDHGGSWNQVGDVKDTQHGWGMRYQPTLYELPEQVGDMPAGTLICAGNAIPTNLSQTSIDLYKSTDHGRTWTFLSTVDHGGAADLGLSSNGPVWEPSLLTINHQLVCYYSDQKVKPQTIDHRTSSDGIHWSDEKEDANIGGMPVVAQMANGKYIMSYEGYRSITNNDPNQATGITTWVKYSDNGLDWDATNPGTKIAGTKGSPYVTVLNDGTIVLNSTAENIYVNKDNGNGAWTSVDTPMGGGYSRSLAALPNNQILIVCGGPMGATPYKTDGNTVIKTNSDRTLTSMVYDLPAQYHRATVQFANQPTSLAAGKTANFTVKLSDGSAADFDITTDDAQDVTVEKQADGSYQLKVNSNFVGQKDVTVTATKKDDASFSANFKVSITGQAAPTPDNNNSTNTGTTGTITTPSSSSQATTTEPSTTQPTTTSQPAATKKFKQFKVYAKTGIRVYKGVDFKHVVKSYAKHSRTNAKTFIITGKAYSKNGALRYKTAAGYITANSKYVAKLYYQTAPKKVTVLAKAGTYEYTKPTFSKANRSTHLKKGTIVKVKKLVKQGSLSKFVLTNGHYLTANKKLIIAQP
ncbi:DUF5776 domain-containing protein [Lentilactobacillus kisonensis]|uniref:DUF5776 domain-containing protein n=2 Tax=Lentilactobacillus kisonensis TaxID=481722 RepID=A0A0R1NTP1_9LACO|nr:DUF5776 domain-containing protein [Lentilactobacillus kisonensis]KRL23065.1 hypothetical protein FC98_GL001101 [Lentilactobacillus kisonensis DSM 19906 = JCM 15041]